MTAEPVGLDRRHRRRLETIEEIIDVATEVMAEFGVGGLSLGEVARRMGMRTPSLYVYFDSKNAVYDAIFARGWRAVHVTMAPAYEGVRDAADLPSYFLDCARLFVGWMLEHPVQAQLMCWRPVPGYEPSALAYEPAVELLAAAHASFEQLRARGLFRADADVELLLRTWTVLTSGVMTQQLANAPDMSFDEGAFTATLPDLRTASALERRTARRLAATEYDRFLSQLHRLQSEDWTKPTDCPGWDVRALVGHVVGMTEMSASVPEQLKQMRAAGKAGASSSTP